MLALVNSFHKYRTDVSMAYPGAMDVELAAVGRNVTDLRKAKGLRLSDLAELTGYTTSYLSQIERGISIPSLTALATVAIALGVETTTLLSHTSGARVRVTRADAPMEIRLPPRGMTFTVLGTHGVEGAYTALALDVPLEPTEARHFGERFVLVLDGELRIGFGEDHHDLGPDDTLHYGAHEVHTFTGLSDTPPRVVIISNPALI